MVAGAEPDPRRWKALVVCLVAGFMTLLDVSIVNVALPSIKRGARRGRQRAAVDRLGLRADARAAAGAGRAALGDARGRRHGVHGRRRAVRARQRRLRARAVRPAAGRRPAAPGRRRRADHAADQRLHPDAVPRARSAAGRSACSARRSGISTAIGPLLGGAADRAVRRPRRLALRCSSSTCRSALLAIVLARYLPAAAPAPGPRTELDPLGVVLLGAGRGLPPRAVRRAAQLAQPAPAGAVRRRRRAARGLGRGTSAATAARASRW